MSSSIVSPLGKGIIALQVGQKISVYSKGVANIYKLTTFADHPNAQILIASTNDSELIIGPYPEITTLTIEGGAYETSYDLGIYPTTIDKRRWGIQPTPSTTSGDGTFSITPDRLKTGISINHETVGTTIIILPTAQQFNDSDVNLKPDDSWDLAIICIDAGSFSFLASTGIDIVGNPAVASATSGIFRFRKISEAQYTVYRIA